MGGGVGNGRFSQYSTRCTNIVEKCTACIIFWIVTHQVNPL